MRPGACILYFEFFPEVLIIFKANSIKLDKKKGENRREAPSQQHSPRALSRAWLRAGGRCWRAARVMSPSMVVPCGGQQKRGSFL